VQIDFDEFLSLMDKKRQYSELDSELRAAFKRFDRRGRGKVSLSDLKASLALLGERRSDAEMQEMMAEADGDQDGELAPLTAL
jgi:calmodulin